MSGFLIINNRLINQIDWMLYIILIQRPAFLLIKGWKVIRLKFPQLLLQVEEKKKMIRKESERKGKKWNMISFGTAIFIALGLHCFL